MTKRKDPYMPGGRAECDRYRREQAECAAKFAGRIVGFFPPNTHTEDAKAAVAAGIEEAYQALLAVRGPGQPKLLTNDEVRELLERLPAAAREAP